MLDTQHARHTRDKGKIWSFPFLLSHSSHRAFDSAIILLFDQMLLICTLSKIIYTILFYNLFFFTSVILLLFHLFCFCTHKQSCISLLCDLLPDTYSVPLQAVGNSVNFPFPAHCSQCYSLSCSLDLLFSSSSDE